MLNSIIPVEQLQRLDPSVIGHDLIIQSFLCSQLAQIYSVVFYPDDKNDSPINPFWDYNKQLPNKKTAEKFKCVFISTDLYVELKKQFELQGYVVKSVEKKPVSSDHSICELPYYPGISYIFVPRT